MRDGQIVLNVSYTATGHLDISNDRITFQARFGGIARDISVPIGNVLAIYAKENGAGMAFEADSDATDGKQESEEDSEPEPPSPQPAGRPRLQRIK